MTEDAQPDVDAVDRRLSPRRPLLSVEWRFMLILPSGFRVDYEADGYDAALERGRRCWHCDWCIEYRQLRDGEPVGEWMPCTPILRNVVVEARDDTPLIVRARDDALLRVFEPDAGANNGRGPH
jgi:hypothetical protein